MVTGSSHSINMCPPHSPTRITKKSILKLPGAFHWPKTSRMRFWAFSYSIGEPCGRSNQLITYFIGSFLKEGLSRGVADVSTQLSREAEGGSRRVADLLSGQRCDIRHAVGVRLRGGRVPSGLRPPFAPRASHSRFSMTATGRLHSAPG